MEGRRRKSMNFFNSEISHKIISRFYFFHLRLVPLTFWAIFCAKNTTVFLGSTDPLRSNWGHSWLICLTKALRCLFFCVRQKYAKKKNRRNRNEFSEKKSRKFNSTFLGLFFGFESYFRKYRCCFWSKLERHVGSSGSRQSTQNRTKKGNKSVPIGFCRNNRRLDFCVFFWPT